MPLRYGNEISLPELYDGCNGQMNVCHTLNCTKGDGHANLRDNGAQMSKFIYPSISCEPVISKAECRHTPALVGVSKIVDLWEAGKILDHGIINTEAPSYFSQDWKTVLTQHAKKKDKNMTM